MSGNFQLISKQRNTVLHKTLINESLLNMPSRPSVWPHDTTLSPQEGIL